MFIAIVGAAVAGVLSALMVSTRGSADPMVQKQALAIAEALLEEVQLQPFTYCDPDDANAATATGTAGCASAIEALGPEAVDVPLTGPAETRAGTVRPFDNVNDFNTFSMGPGITDLSGSAIGGLDGYSATVGIAGLALGGISATESLFITVTVTHSQLPSGVVVHGYRVRYAPNALP